jgi:NAD(P)-dependent dehydrogenase (short-subunit alcohol dehydrogenase family)
VFHSDVRLKQDFESLIDKVTGHFGALHILVNNASHTRFGPVDEVTEEDFDDLVGTSLRGPFFGSIAAARKMGSYGGGSIINISSCATGLMIPLHSGYTMVKGGLEALTRQLAFELAPQVRVNCLAPGATSTDRNRKYDVNFDSKWASITPAGRVAHVEDYVGPCVFLAGDESAFMTGQILRVDGGWTLKGHCPDMSDYDLSDERKRG